METSLCVPIPLCNSPVEFHFPQNMCSNPIVYQSHCVLFPRERPYVPKPNCVSVPTCPSLVVFHSHGAAVQWNWDREGQSSPLCVPIPLCISPVIFHSHRVAVQCVTLTPNQNPNPGTGTQRDRDTTVWDTTGLGHDRLEQNRTGTQRAETQQAGTQRAGA